MICSRATYRFGSTTPSRRTMAALAWGRQPSRRSLNLKPCAASQTEAGNMHELSIAMSIVELAQEESERRGGARITAVHLKLGALAGVVKEALLSSYEMAREDTRLQGSQLIIEEIPVVVFCPSCRAEDPALDSIFPLRGMWDADLGG